MDRACHQRKIPSIMAIIFVSSSFSTTAYVIYLKCLLFSQTDSVLVLQIGALELTSECKGLQLLSGSTGNN